MPTPGKLRTVKPVGSLVKDDAGNDEAGRKQSRFRSRSWPLLCVGALQRTRWRASSVMSYRAITSPSTSSTRATVPSWSYCLRRGEIRRLRQGGRRIGEGRLSGSGPQPRGAGKSTGLKEGITLHDLANDVALTVANAQDGQAIIVGHAFGNWVARMTAADHPELVRGVVIAAAASKDYPKDLLVSLRDAGNVALPDQQRLAALRIAFFAPGNDPSIWLKDGVRRSLRIGVP